MLSRSIKLHFQVASRALHRRGLLRQLSQVAWPVCLSAGHTGVLQKRTAEPIEMRFGGGGRAYCRGPEKPSIRWESRFAREEAFFWVERPTAKHWDALLRCTQHVIIQSSITVRTAMRPFGKILNDYLLSFPPDLNPFVYWCPAVWNGDRAVWRNPKIRANRGLIH